MTEVEKLSQNQNERERTDTQSPVNSSIDVRKAVRQQLKSLRLAGLTHLPKGTGNYTFASSEAASAPIVTDQPSQSKPESNKLGPAPAQPESVKESAPAKSVYTKEPGMPLTSPASTSPQTGLISSDPWEKSLPLSDRKSALQILQNEIAGCTKCDELSSQRTQTVFGVGNPAARLVFVGEAPGAQEDRQGEPFVGEAGRLLDKILEACKLSRADVFILNTVKCRPPGNRNPGQEELANCWGYAERQLEILQPEFICCLGSVAARTLLKTTESLGRLRKRFHSYRGSQVLVTYHPAYLLRTPSAKRHVWDDMKMLMKEMGVDLSK